MKYVDDFLNNITMYRLVLYFLIVLAFVGLIYSVFGVLPFDPLSYTFSFVFILLVSWTVNLTFAEVFEAPANIESFWISALILGLIIPPAKNVQDIIFAGWAAVLAMALKYILAIGKKHIFNPVAISVALTAFAINGAASWWVGNLAMLPVVAIGGFLIIRKIKRWDLVLSFLITGLIVMGPTKWAKILTDSPLIFFAAIMISEPLTTPPRRILRIIYGAIVGFLFAPQIHFGSIFSTPELALIIGNIFSYIVSPKYKLILKLKEKIRLTHDIYDFVFTTNGQINFISGQYMEWTFAHPKADDRGNRRFLTIASSPTEQDIHIGIKFEDPPSSYKRNLFEMTGDQKIVASQLTGDFTMPKDPNAKLVFVAGGIGITPFRSMIKYLTDKQSLPSDGKNEKRDIILIYVAKNPDDFVYKEVFDEAGNKIGIKTFYIASSVSGHLDAGSVAKMVPDYAERTYYLSGSHGMVTSFEEILKTLEIPAGSIVTDYFPGFA